MKIDGMTAGRMLEKQRGANRNTGKAQGVESQVSGSFSNSLLEQQGENPGIADEKYLEADMSVTKTGTSMAILSSGRISVTTSLECAVRHLTYDESDNVKVCVSEGFTFKAKVDVSGHSVYVEMKGEDGSVKGYEVDPLKVDKNTEDEIEKMALESWEMAGRCGMGDGIFTPIGGAGGYEAMTLEHALESFYNFVRQKLGTNTQKQDINARTEEELLQAVPRDREAPAQEQILKLLQESEEEK